MALQNIAVYWVLPFVLIFVLVFAILQRSKLFGEDKQQINVMIGSVIGALFVAVPGPHVDIVISMLPVLAIALVVMLVFFLIYGFFIGENIISEQKKPFFVIGGLILAVVFIIGILYYLTPARALIDGFISTSGDTFFTFVFIGIIAALLFRAVNNGGSSSDN